MPPEAYEVMNILGTTTAVSVNVPSSPTLLFMMLPLTDASPK